jgi:TolB-like protein/cytochrome c-type biogenesis protein CcmH/NrfG
MADEQKEKQRLEIAHVLFMDIVGYSRLLTDEQSEALQELNQIVRGTEAARDAEAGGRLTILPTGDGMALVFTGSVEEPAECALEISRALRAQPSLPVRMGIHSGPIHHVKDANGRENIAGVGINIAQRVMDCGDAGHILVSKRVADDLAQQRRWQPYLHELGDVEVKHGVVVSLVNLYAETIGNPTPPSRLGKVRGSLRALSKGPRKGLSPVARAIFIILGLFIALGFVLAIVAVIFAPAIMRTLDQHRSATLPQPSATAAPSLADTIRSAVTKQITDELQSELSRKKKAPVEPTPAGSPIPEKSIAVLPFENLSEEKGTAYFAEGVQDEILTRLAKISDLKVISRTSTQHFKRAPENLSDIAKKLGVMNILEGSVQKAGDQVRVNVQLINALKDSHLWAETYDRKLVDLFQVETDIAQKIAGALEAKLSGREQKDISGVGSNNPEAYDAYLHGLALSRSAMQSEVDKSIQYLRRAVELDPNFAEAWAELGIGESFKYFVSKTNEAQKERAEAAVETARRLAPDSVDTHGALGLFYYYCLKDFDRALSELQIAKERDPNNATTIFSISLVKRRQGKIDEAIALLEQAANLDPLNSDIWTNLAGSYRGTRKISEARAFFDRALNVAPNDLGVIAQKAETFLAEGNPDAAWKILSGVSFPPTELGFATTIQALVYQRRFKQAEEMITEALKDTDLPPLFRAVAVTGLARLKGGRGDRAGAHGLFTQAEAELKKLHANGENSLLLLDSLIEVEAGLGHRGEVNQLAQETMEKVRPDLWESPHEEEVIARAYVVLGDLDHAFPMLEHVLSVPYVAALTPAMLRIDPAWDSVRKDPRFQKLANPQP